MSGPFQTRRDSGELRYFATLREAMADAADESVWKVSFDAVSGERVRLVRHDQGWVYEPLPTLA